MARRSALVYAAAGAIIAEAMVSAVVLWAYSRYSTSIVVGFGLWKPVFIIALLGAGTGLAVLAVRRAFAAR